MKPELTRRGILATPKPKHPAESSNCKGLGVFGFSVQGLEFLALEPLCPPTGQPETEPHRKAPPHPRNHYTTGREFRNLLVKRPPDFAEGCSQASNPWARRLKRFDSPSIFLIQIPSLEDF